MARYNKNKWHNYYLFEFYGTSVTNASLSLLSLEDRLSDLVDYTIREVMNKMELKVVLEVKDSIVLLHIYSTINFLDGDIIDLSNGYKRDLDASISIIRSLEITSIKKTGEIKSLMFRYNTSLGIDIDMQDTFVDLLIHEEKFTLDFDKLYSYKGFNMLKNLSSSLFEALDKVCIDLRYPKESTVNVMEWAVKGSPSKNVEMNDDSIINITKKDPKWKMD
jgi:hypothetical protein